MQPEGFHRLSWCGIYGSQQEIYWLEGAQADQVQSKLVGSFRFKFEEQGTEEKVHL
jgi:hypothetical protein